jgi:hypothetical protein
MRLLKQAPLHRGKMVPGGKINGAGVTGARDYSLLETVVESVRLEVDIPQQGAEITSY